ncbi:MAG: imidazolonepropionase-like amidohydrolase [Planctomycetota bacterium]
MAKRTQASVHTQMYQVVLQTINQLKGEFGIDVYIDHGSIGAWRVGDIAQEMGVPAILGPRNADTIVRGFIEWGQLGAEDVGFRGSAAGYQERGHKLIGFNTDSPVIPQQELQLQAGMAVRYGMDDSGMETVRGLTINPAIAAGIAHRVGSLEPGKDADVVVISGPPGDPRSWVERVWLDGVNVYNSNTEHRRW